MGEKNSMESCMVSFYSKRGLHKAMPHSQEPDAMGIVKQIKDKHDFEGGE